MKAVILAGGEGTRLRPVTYEIPKPLIPVQGRPVIEYPLENLLAYGCEKIFIIIGVEHEAHFRKWQEVYIEGQKIRPGVMQFIFEKTPRGTFGALALAKEYVKDDQSFFVSNADELKDVNLGEVVRAHQSGKGVATMPVAQVNLDLAKSLGVAEVDENGKVLSYIEKPESPKSSWISIGGPYVMTNEIFKYYDNSKDKSLIEYDLWEVLPQKGLLWAYKHLGQYFGTDTLEKWERAIKEYKHNPPKY